MEHFDIQNLTFSHAAAKGKLSLSGVSLRIRAGEFLVLCGCSGSGKTGTDWLLLALEIALPVLVLAFGDAKAAYTPDLYIAPLRGLPVLGFAAYAAFLLIPTVLHIKETVQWNISISRI